MTEPQTREEIGSEIVSELVKKTKLEKALVAAMPFLTPMIHRGMDNSKWIAAMKLVADAFDWLECEECGGTGEIEKMDPAINVLGQINQDRKLRTYLCTRCYAVGRIDPEG